MRRGAAAAPTARAAALGGARIGGMLIAAVLSAILAGALLVATGPVARADTGPANPSEPATTSAPAPPPSTSTATASTTTSTAVPDTARGRPSPPPGGPPAGRVPNIPTGGPPTSMGAPPPPAPDPGPVVTAVEDDMAQLQAISTYTEDQATVASTTHAVEVASAALDRSRATEAGATARRRGAQRALQHDTATLGQLALAAYTGAGTGPVSLQLDSGARESTSSPTGFVQALSGGLRAKEARAREAVAVATQKAAAAGEATARAAAVLADARQSLASSQHAVTLAAQAAVTPGLAAADTGPHTGQSIDGPPSERAATAVTGATGGSGASSAAIGSATASSPSVLGPTLLTGPELAAWYGSTGHQASTTVPIGELADDYVAAGQQTGVRADIAFAQSIVETGYFSFPAGGQLTAADNNFAGIGACDSCAHGWAFPDARTGVTAQLELLQAYASPSRVATPLIGPVGVGGCCPTWMALTGTWATSQTYGVSILRVYDAMLQATIPGRLAKAGLPAVAAPPASR